MTSFTYLYSFTDAKAHFFTSKYVPAAGRQRKFSPDVSTFDQHLGGNLPTPNINVLEGPFQQFGGALDETYNKYYQ